MGKWNCKNDSLTFSDGSAWFKSKTYFTIKKTVSIWVPYSDFTLWKVQGCRFFPQSARVGTPKWQNEKQNHIVVMVLRWILSGQKKRKFFGLFVLSEKIMFIFLIHWQIVFHSFKHKPYYIYLCLVYQLRIYQLSKINLSKALLLLTKSKNNS